MEKPPNPQATQYHIMMTQVEITRRDLPHYIQGYKNHTPSSRPPHIRTRVPSLHPPPPSVRGVHRTVVAGQTIHSIYITTLYTLDIRVAPMCQTNYCFFTHYKIMNKNDYAKKNGAQTQAYSQCGLECHTTGSWQGKLNVQVTEPRTQDLEENQ